MINFTAPIAVGLMEEGSATDNRSMNKKLLLSALAGVVSTLLVVGGIQASRSMSRLGGEPSSQAIQKLMTPFAVDPTWVKSGSPNFRATETARSPDGKTIVGQWACDGPTTFEWTFGLDETVHLLDGEVHVDYLGRKFTLKPGDTATFHHGTKAVWTVPQKAHKVYVLHHPGFWAYFRQKYLN
ncbi:MAG: hypothetical protein C4K60_20815 [Ideonella sp. MAG2]|nr:MAG: hypothetical protein C4K60_20815 [Ideonella sp. MAG2]